MMFLMCWTGCASSSPPDASSAEVAPGKATSEAAAPAASASADPSPIEASPATAVKVTVDDPAVNFAFAQQTDKLRRCYDDALSSEPSTEVEWACFFRRDASGRVTSVTIPGESHQELRECVSEVVKAAEFPAPETAGELQTFFVFMKRAPE